MCQGGAVDLLCSPPNSFSPFPDFFAGILLGAGGAIVMTLGKPAETPSDVSVEAAVSRLSLRFAFDPFAQLIMCVCVGVGGVGDDPWTRGLVCTLTPGLVDLWTKNKTCGS